MVKLPSVPERADRLSGVAELVRLAMIQASAMGLPSVERTLPEMLPPAGACAHARRMERIKARQKIRVPVIEVTTAAWPEARIRAPANKVRWSPVGAEQDSCQAEPVCHLGGGGG